MDEVRVEVTRSGRTESVHVVDLAAVGPDGALLEAAGDPDRPVFARSAVKPFQALPLVEDGVVERFGLTDEELALCCASHSGDPGHVTAARSILSRIEVDESALACGPHAPFDEGAASDLARKGLEPLRVHNNCSGKHAGMLALARAHGWPTDGYHEPDHPVQRRVLDLIAEWTGEDRDSIGIGVDGCGVVTFALPLRSLATAFARLAESARDPASPAGRVLHAMTSHPHMVAGAGRLCTRLMEVTRGRVVAKVGAEGVYGAAAVDRRIGIALKARDGARRAAESALLVTLESLELIDAQEARSLHTWSRPEIHNTRGEVVGSVRTVVEPGRVDG